MNLGIYICLCAVLRIGEVCALVWDDIDVEAGVINISKTIERIYVIEGYKKHTEVIIDTPKSKNSIREIPIGISKCWPTLPSPQNLVPIVIITSVWWISWICRSWNFMGSVIALLRGASKATATIRPSVFCWDTQTSARLSIFMSILTWSRKRNVSNRCSRHWDNW